MSHDPITRYATLVALLGALAVAPAAQAFVTQMVAGSTTTYFEDFNGGSEFLGEAWTPNSPTHPSDNFIELGPLGGNDSRFIFTSDAPIRSLSLDFRYAGALESGNGTVSLSRLADNGVWSAYFMRTLDDTPGSFNQANPGLFLNGNESGNDAPFSLTLADLPAGTHMLAFERILPLEIGDPHPQLRVDDVLLAVTAVPEPGSALMLCAGLAGLASVRCRTGLALRCRT
jgi:hypothetical protein